MNLILGTLRKNRGEPKIVRTAGDKQHKLNKGDIVERDNGQVLVFAWKTIELSELSPPNKAWKWWR